MGKQVNVDVVGVIADLAIVKEYREDPQPLVVFDLYQTYEVDGEISKNLLASDRYELLEDAPFELTEEEIAELR